MQAIKNIAAIISRIWDELEFVLMGGSIDGSDRGRPNLVFTPVLVVAELYKPDTKLGFSLVLERWCCPVCSMVSFPIWGSLRCPGGGV